MLFPKTKWHPIQKNHSWSPNFANQKFNSPCHMGMGQNLVPLVNIKIAGKWMFIPLKMVLIGIDPYPYEWRAWTCWEIMQPVQPVAYAWGRKLSKVMDVMAMFQRFRTAIALPCFAHWESHGPQNENPLISSAEDRPNSLNSLNCQGYQESSDRFRCFCLEFGPREALLILEN